MRNQKTKNYKTLILLCFIAIMVVCCKSTKSTTGTTVAADPLAPTQSDVAIAQAHWSGTTLDNLNKGYSILTNQCTDCHGVKKPQNFTVDDWNSILPNMGRRAKLDSTQYNQVFHYILAKRESILGSGK